MCKLLHDVLSAVGWPCRGIQQRGMAQDLSWDHAAEQYEQVLIDAKYQW
jgi:hypothetical protein